VPVNPSIILTVSLVFRIERGILALVASAPSSDAQARAVAVGSSKDFAVWRVAERTATQLLMCDRYESTRSRFGVVPTGLAARSCSSDQPSP
jgi:hypothetical protein